MRRNLATESPLRLIWQAKHCFGHEKFSEVNFDLREVDLDRVGLMR
jgi:hypothetical protein